MKRKRFICGRYMASKKRNNLGFHLSDENCNVCDCPRTINDVDEGRFFCNSRHNPNAKKSTGKQFKITTETEASIPVSKYFFDSLAKSAIYGIRNLALTRNLCGKLIWLVVLALSLSGFSFQALIFYLRYQDKPSIVQTEVENNGRAYFPAVSVCNTNRFRLKTFCKYFSEKCISGNKTLSDAEINEILYNLLLSKQEDLRKKLGHTITMLLSCVFKGATTVVDEECLSMWEYFYDPDYGNCYTFTATNKNNKSLQVRKVDFWQEKNGLTLVMDSEPEDFMEKKRVNGLIIAIHDKKNFPDLHTALLATPGNSYTIAISQSTILLLPSPYKTNCSDYLSLPWQKLRHRTLTPRLCTVGCSQHFQLQKCHVVTKNLSLFYRSLPYDKSDITEENINCSIYEEKRTRKYCRKICGLPCRDTVYSTAVVKSKLSDRNLNPETADREDHIGMSIYDDIIHVKIFFSTMDHKIFRHVPKYTRMELFSHIGGYSGVWLGFSLLTIFELVQIIFSTISYCFSTKASQRQHKKSFRSEMKSSIQTKVAVKRFKKKRSLKKFT